VVEDTAIPADEVKAQLDRILASKGFASAGRLSRLLRYVVEKTLGGEADQLKEYSVGVEVFDRDDKYDPRLDSIVRVEAGRLRSRLDEYYGGEGANDDVRIVLPRGGYSAQFERRAAPVVPPEFTTTPAASSRSSWALVFVGVLAVATIAVWLYGSRSRSEVPTIAVLAFEQYSSSGEDESVAAQLTDGVTSELARLGTLGVVSHTSAMQFAGVRKPLREIAAALDADVIMEGSVENKPDGIVVVARLVNAATDRKMWVENFPGKADDLQDLNRRIASAVSAAVLSRSPSP
jgi:adenylate cyclase